MMMDWSWSSANIHPSNLIGGHGWDLSQANNHGDNLPPVEPLQLNQSFIEHFHDQLDSVLGPGLQLDSGPVEFDYQQCFCDGRTALASLSLIGSVCGSVIPINAASGLVSTDATKPAAEPVELQTKARNVNGRLEKPSCNYSLDESNA